MHRSVFLWGASALVTGIASGQTAPGLLLASDPSWSETVQADLQREHYEVRDATTDVAAPTLAADNAAQALCFSFSRDGLRVRSQAGAAQPFEWGLELQSFGRTGAMERAEAVDASCRANRVEYLRGPLTEWYVNDARGLEHGFTVARPPEGSGPLVLRLAVIGGLAQRPGEGRIDFLHPDGQLALSYDHLLVLDADGASVPAKMIARDGAIDLWVEDDGASYPLTVDPLISTWSWAVESNASNAQLGFSVATAGDVNGDGYSDVIVGAPYWSNVGMARIYLGSSSGLSTTHSAQITGVQSGEELGYSVGTAGDVNGDGRSDVIIGSRGFDTTGQDAGRVAIHLGTLFAEGILINPALVLVGATGSLFGSAVATAGDTNGDGYTDFLVGAPRGEVTTQLEGIALVFNGGLNLPTNPWRTLHSSAFFAAFGTSVGWAGDVNADGFADVIVGAPTQSNGQTDEGFAFVYNGSSSGTSLTPSWTKESNQAFARYGTSVGTAGDVNGDGFSDVIVGSPGFSNGPGGEGWAFVYHGSATTLGVGPAWIGEGNVANANYGYAVGTAGDVNGDGFADVLVGAPNLNEPLGAPLGKVFAYHGSPSGLSSIPGLVTFIGFGAPEFGFSVGTAGDVNGDGFSDAIFGARFVTNGESKEGRAQVHLGSAGSFKPAAAVVIESNSAGARLGPVATAGDVNGDGFEDIIVGEPGFTNGGRARVFHGGAQLGTAGTTGSPAWTVEANQSGAEYGASVACAGDVNSDGYSDVIVGSPGALIGAGQPNGGGVRVYHGAKTGLSTVAGFENGSIQSLSDLGFSVSGAGDVNGDGFCDVIFSAPLRDAGEVDEGQAFVVHGSSLGLNSTYSWTAQGNQAGALFGYSVACAGDLNGDGFSDVIVGARNYDNGQVDEGRAYFFHGSATGLFDPDLGVQPFVVESNQAQSFFGTSVAGAGDANGDGFPDTIVGAPFDDTFSLDGGMARVYAGSATTPQILMASLYGPQIYGQSGASVSGAGDVNGDGFADVLVGAPNGNDGDSQGTTGNKGIARFYFGGAGGPVGGPVSQYLLGAQVDAGFGSYVAYAGDLNGDAYADVLVGSPGHDAGQTDEGAVFVYLGNDGTNTSPFRMHPRQLRATDGGPLPRLGTSPTDGFRMEVLRRSPFGRSDVAVEWKVIKAAGPISQFGGVNYADTGANGVDFSTIVTGLPEGLFAWQVRNRYRLAKSPLQTTGPWLSIPWNTGNEADLRIVHAPSKIAVDSVAPIKVTVVLGANAPAPVVRQVSNAGGLPLNWAAVVTPGASWLTVSPAGAAAQLPSDAAVPMSVSFKNAGLTVGAYQTTLRLDNTDSTDFIDIPVTLTVIDQPFLPEDTLSGNLVGALDMQAATFNALKGMQLLLKFSGAQQNMKLLVTVEGASKTQSFKVKLTPGGKISKVVKLKEEGLHTVRFVNLTGSGPYLVKTKIKKLPSKAAHYQSKTVAGKNGLANVPFTVLPGAKLTASVKPKGGFVGPISLGLFTPAGLSISLGQYQSAGANGGLTIALVPLAQGGKYNLQVTGFGSNKDKVKILMAIIHPSGGYLVVLP